MDVSNGGLAISVCSDNRQLLWDSSTGCLRVGIPVRDCLIGTYMPVLWQRVSPPDRRVPVVSNTICDYLKSVYMFSNLEFLSQRSLEGHIGDVYTCRFFPSGLVMLSGGADFQLRIWSAETGECPVVLKGHSAGMLDTWKLL